MFLPIKGTPIETFSTPPQRNWSTCATKWAVGHSFMQIAKVMISSVYPHFACHESVKLNLYLINIKTHKRTFQD